MMITGNKQPGGGPWRTPAQTAGKAHQEPPSNSKGTIAATCGNAPTSVSSHVCWALFHCSEVWCASPQTNKAAPTPAGMQVLKQPKPNNQRTAGAQPKALDMNALADVTNGMHQNPEGGVHSEAQEGDRIKVCIINLRIYNAHGVQVLVQLMSTRHASWLLSFTGRAAPCCAVLSTVCRCLHGFGLNHRRRCLTPSNVVGYTAQASGTTCLLAASHAMPSSDESTMQRLIGSPPGLSGGGKGWPCAHNGAYCVTNAGSRLHACRKGADGLVELDMDTGEKSPETSTYSLDGVFGPDASQEDVYRGKHE